ncbi:MAG TPA: adenylate/guanylate cyclase domain-containing protein [Actinomycetota bacterium]|nr:adenylate/guanylate cyclase domain-containing protein [Actinomycetota bacterium]
MPTGTVTLLFTDVEASTALLQELGSERYAEALTDHRQALRGAFSRHGGVEVDVQGDAIFVAFGDARAALDAARDGQRALEHGPIKVRMGLHSGKPIVTDEGYVGIDVHRAARICASAHGGQVVFSEQTRTLAGADHEVVDLGLHRLKDLGPAERLFQLGRGEFPPLRSLNATNLPAQLGRLIGRQREVAELVRLAGQERLITLTGAGGSGKTRLALHVAAELVGTFPDGVFWVPLASVTEPELVPPTIVSALGAKGELADIVGQRHMLLVLDNLEQVADVAPQLSHHLRSSRRLHLLVTSRSLLRIEGEREYAVEPLPADDAVALFLERAAVADPAEAVAQICRRLDGLPLAVELAAARTAILPPEQLLARLDQRLPLLTGGRRDAPARQRTLRAAIAWSYDLLDEDERRLFRQLAVFAGSFDSAAAEGVASADLDSLQSLVEKSLVRRWSPGRLGMLETIREFARGELQAAGEADVLRRAHARFFLARAQEANLYNEAEGRERFDLVAPEVDNVRAALDWALVAEEVELGARIAVALEHFWVARSPFEGMRWLRLLVERGRELPLDVRAAALRVWGSVTYIVGRFEEGADLYEQSLEIYRRLGDERGMGLLLLRLAVWHRTRGDLATARRMTEESEKLLGRTGFGRSEALVRSELGEIVFEEGEHDQGMELMEESAALAEDIGFLWWAAATLGILAGKAISIGRRHDAELWARRAVRLAHEIGERQFLVYALADLARLATHARLPERAGTLWGAVETEERRGPVGQWEGEREAYAAEVMAAASPGFEHGRRAGRALSLDEAVAYAVAET